MKREEIDDLGFTFFRNKREEVVINRNGSKVTILRNKKATDFVEVMGYLEFKEQQQLMARITGNYKRGNEKYAKKHFRNK